MVTRTLIRNGIVLPLEGDKVVFDPGSVLIEGDDDRRRRDRSTEIDADPRAAGAEVVDATGHAVHPRPAQLPPALGSAAGHGRVDVAVGLAGGLRRPGPQGLTPEIAEAAIAALAYTEGAARPAPRR